MSFAQKIDPLGPHFCLVKARDKDPSVGGPGWQKPENLMLSTDPRLLGHLKQGGNYGVVGGFGLAILDADAQEIKELVKDKLPETFTVLSPGHQGWHCYYLCGLEKPLRLRDDQGENVGDIQGQGKMVVGPGCVHPNGGVYEIVKDLPLAQVTKDQLVEALKEYVVPEKEISLIEENARKEKQQTGVELDILQVVPLSRLHKQGEEYYGAHPVHGSESKRNFWVNPAKNVWHCFRHGTGGGPLLWVAVEEGIIDCASAGPGALRGEVFKKVLLACEKRGLIKVPLSAGTKAHVEEQESVTLSHLNMIEDPDVAGKPVTVEAVVSSTSIPYTTPAEVGATFTDKDGNVQATTSIQISEKNPFNIKLVGINDEIKFKRLKRLAGGDERSRVRVEETAWRTVYRIRIRPPVFTLEKHGEKVVDERGFEYKSYDVFVVSSKPIVFEPSSLLRVEGLVLPNPRTQKTTLLIYNVEFPEETYSFNIENLNKLKQKFSEKTIGQRVEWILENFEKYSLIVGRQNLAFAALLDYFTPLYVKLNNEVQRGWANIALIGDTTTAKSETLRKLIRLLEAGTLITGETASTVGLVGTATQIEKEGWFVDWGFLVLNDKKLLAVDGAHKLPFSQWAALAEAERTGVVTIAKAAKDSAYARTRQIKIANPVDREVDKFTTKTLSSFLYPVQSLATVFDKTSIARLDLVAFADQRDVDAGQINIEFKTNYDEDLKLLADVLRWCWSNATEVKFTSEAVDALLKASTELYSTFFSELIPLVSIDMKWKLARLTSALAYLTLSTEDYKEVTVTEEHVKVIVDFLKREYSKGGLNTLAQETRFEKLEKEDATAIVQRIKEATVLEETTLREILRYIVLHGRVTRDEIRTKFTLKENSELRPLLAMLASEALVTIGRGFYPTAKMIQLFKVLEENNP
jgi:hypothetical protein